MRERVSRSSLAGLGLIPIIAISACASSGGVAGGDWEPPPWPSGHFELLATFSYRLDTEAREGTRQEQVRGELYIAPDESMTFRSSTGLCHARSQMEVESDQSQGRRTFPCEGARFVLRPLAGTVGGEVSVTVREGYRRRGGCIQWDQSTGGQRVCLEYSWNVIERSTTKRANLRVMAGS